MPTWTKPKSNWLSVVLTIGSQFDSVPAPPARQKANSRATVPALIEDHIALPSLLRLRRRSYLEALCSGQQQSVRKISRLTGASRSAVLEALDRFGIPQNGNGRKRVGPLPFGFDYLNYKLVNNKAEHEVHNLPQMAMYR